MNNLANAIAFTVVGNFRKSVYGNSTVSSWEQKAIKDRVRFYNGNWDSFCQTERNFSDYLKQAHACP